MSDAPEFAAAVTAALERVRGGPLAALFPVPAVTALVVSGSEPDRIAALVRGVGAALIRIGVPRGRLLVVVAAPEGALALDAGTFVRALRRVLDVPVSVHDPERSPCFVAGPGAHGVVLELDDELREAEAIVCAAPMGERSPLFPGLASRAARERFAALDAPARRDVLAAAADAAPANVSLVWGTRRCGEWVVAAAGDEAFAGDASAES